MAYCSPTGELRRQVIGHTKNKKITDFSCWHRGKLLQSAHPENGKYAPAGRRTYECSNDDIEKTLWMAAQLTKIASNPDYIVPEPPKPVPETPPKFASDPQVPVEQYGFGSGFAISAVGHFVTNHHVIDGCQQVRIHHKGKEYLADIIAFDQVNDLALLKATLEPDVALKFAAQKPMLAQDIYVAGFPFGGTDGISASVKVTRGIVSALTGLENNLSQFQMDAPIQPGNSGGPVLNSHGDLLGVAVGALSDSWYLEKYGVVPEGSNFAIKSTVVESLLDANLIPYAKEDPQELTPQEFSDLLMKGTYFLSCWMTKKQIRDKKKKRK